MCSPVIGIEERSRGVWRSTREADDGGTWIGNQHKSCSPLAAPSMDWLVLG